MNRIRHCWYPIHTIDGSNGMVAWELKFRSSQRASSVNFSMWPWKWILWKIGKLYPSFFLKLFWQSRAGTFCWYMTQRATLFWSMCNQPAKFLDLTYISMAAWFIGVKPLCATRTDILPQDLVKYRSREIGYHNDRIAPKFYGYLGSAATEVPVKF